MFYKVLSSPDLIDGHNQPRYYRILCSLGVTSPKQYLDEPGRWRRTYKQCITGAVENNNVVFKLMLAYAAMEQVNLSERGYRCVPKLARTIADLAGCEQIQAAHPAKAPHFSLRENCQKI